MAGWSGCFDMHTDIGNSCDCELCRVEEKYMKILLVEDDSDLAAALGWSLKSEGFDIKRAECLEAAKQLLNDEAPDLVLLDVMLPDGEGYEFCEYIRNRDAQLPVIFLTALDGEKEVVKAFGAGADDYVTKPFRTAELVARIRLRMNG